LVRWSPDGTKLVSGSPTNIVSIWDAATGEQVNSFLFQTQILEIAWSPDGNQLAVAQGTDTIQVVTVLEPTATPTNTPTPTETPTPTPTVTPSGSAFPSTGILDDFNRADGSLGSTWSGSTAGYAIASSQLSVGEGDVFWNAARFGVDQEAFVTLAAINPNSSEIDLLLKAQSNTSWLNGVIEVLYSPALNAVQVWTFTTSQDWVQRGADIPVAASHRRAEPSMLPVTR